MPRPSPETAFPENRSRSSISLIVSLGRDPSSSRYLTARRRSTSARWRAGTRSMSTWITDGSCHAPPTRLGADRTLRAASSASALTSHSHTRTTVQSRSSASAVDLSSRSRLRRILSAQRSAFGPVQGVWRPWTGQPCQKHPSTNTAMRRPGRTKSGVQPFARRRWSRNRPPSACTAFRSTSSGDVLTRRRPDRCAPAVVLTQFVATV